MRGVSMAVRFWAKVDQSGGPDACWPWLAYVDHHGYGKFGTTSRKITGAHRIAYEFLVGPIPEGLVIDHLCRVRHCVNPSHMEPVTRGENVRRGVGGEVHRNTDTCRNGLHPWPESAGRYGGPHGQLMCLECKRTYSRERNRAIRARELEAQA